MKPLVIYHTDCTDGYAAAFAAWLKLGDEAEYLPMQYGFKPHEMPSFTDREVYMVDFSWPRDLMVELFEKAERVVWLDHHKTAFEMWCGKAPDLFFTIHKEADDQKHIVLDDCKSGALLAWEYFHPGTEVPLLIRHIDARDRWQFKLDGSKELHAALASMKPWSFEQWQTLFMTERGRNEVFFPVEKCQVLRISGAAILRAQDAHIKSMLKQARKCEISFHEEAPGVMRQRVFRSGLALNTPSHMSEVGHELANSSGTFGLVWYLGADNRVKCSLRSNGDYDVSAIARAFGGGGHKNAAGFEVPVDRLLDWLS